MNRFLKQRIYKEVIKNQQKILFFKNGDIFSVNITDNQNRCIDYDIDYYPDNIFNVESISEYAVFLLPKFNIKICKIHIYDWNSSIEQIETFESIDKYQILALPYTSNIFIITIGAIDIHNRPYEQVIRIAVKENP